MGTSRSFRSPRQPRWHSVLAYIANDEPHELIRAELFNAGVLDGWNGELGRPGISVYVSALVEAHGQLSGAMREAVRPEDAIEQIVGSTRERALRLGAGPSLAIAERALIRTLIGAARGPIALGTSDRQQAVAAWESGRGSPAGLVSRFLGEVLHQYTCHVIARDAGQIVGHGAYEGARSVRHLERSLASEARLVGASVEVSGSAAELPHRWPSLVNEAFRRAATPPAVSGG